MTRWLVLGLCSFAVACSPVPGKNDGGFGDGGPRGDGGLAQFGFTDLDTTTQGIGYLAMAIDPGAERVGIAYVVQVDAFGGTKPDGGSNTPAADGGNTANFEIRYVEWVKGVAKPVEKIRTVQRQIGVTVAFQQNGEPAVSYLGGGSDMSAYWFQSDAVVTYRSNGVWTERLALQMSSDAPCPSDEVPPGATPTEIGFAVGVFPALVFDGPTAILAFRDIHNGQFPMQDWAASDVKVSSGTTTFTTACAVFCGNTKQGYGGRISMVMAQGQPAMVYDKALGGADAPGANILFQKRNADLSWTKPVTVVTIANTMSGGSLAYDPVEGYGVAVLERSMDKLYYARSVDGVAWSIGQGTIFGTGSGGWYPSLAMDPIYHEPAVAFYICSTAAGGIEFNCPANQDELRIIQRIEGIWKEVQVDPDGAYLPKIGFFATGKRVVAYRLPGNGHVRLAVER